LWAFLTEQGPAPSPLVGELAVFQYWVPSATGSDDFCQLLDRNGSGANCSRSFLAAPSGWMLNAWASKRVNTALATSSTGDASEAAELLNAIDRHGRERFMNQRDQMPKTIEIYIPRSGFRDFCSELYIADSDRAEDWLLRLIVDGVRHRALVIGLLDDKALAGWQQRSELERFDEMTVIDGRFLVCRERGAVARGWLQRHGNVQRCAYLDRMEALLSELPRLVGHGLDSASVESALGEFLR
jgi:hypothetical protein